MLIRLCYNVVYAYTIVNMLHESCHPMKNCLQVVNYGIGGHYEPHYDFARV